MDCWVRHGRPLTRYVLLAAHTAVAATGLAAAAYAVTQLSSLESAPGSAWFLAATTTVGGLVGLVGSLAVWGAKCGASALLHLASGAYLVLLAAESGLVVAWRSPGALPLLWQIAGRDASGSMSGALDWAQNHTSTAVALAVSCMALQALAVVLATLIAALPAQRKLSLSWNRILDADGPATPLLLSHIPPAPAVQQQQQWRPQQPRQEPPPPAPGPSSPASTVRTVYYTPSSNPASPFLSPTQPQRTQQPAQQAPPAAVAQVLLSMLGSEQAAAGLASPTGSRSAAISVPAVGQRSPGPESHPVARVGTYYSSPDAGLSPSPEAGRGPLA